MRFSHADSSPKAVRSKFDKNKLECDMAFDCSPQRHLAANGFGQWSIVIFRRPAAGRLLAGAVLAGRAALRAAAKCSGRAAGVLADGLAHDDGAL